MWSPSATVYWAAAPPIDDRRALSSDEHTRALGYRHDGARAGFVTGRRLLRGILSAVADLDVAPADWPIEVSAEGQPLLRDGTERGLSLSHAPGLVVAAVLDRPGRIGVDVEDPDRMVRWERLVKRFFTPTESAALFALPEADQRARFFALWTTNEAYIKALGTGMATPLSSFEVAFDPVRIVDRPEWELRSTHITESGRHFPFASACDVGPTRWVRLEV